jgi:D-ribose pyranose/furanose isomerase RbsD
MHFTIIRLVSLVALLCLHAQAADPVTDKLRAEIPKLGHRNWIVVADSAYPLQNAAGIETIVTSEEHLAVVSRVIEELAKTKHVKPTILTDTELPHVAETHAPGITQLREGLSKLLAKQPSLSLPHEEIIAKLDEAGKTFRILLIKTPLTLPYTSVFFQLECGYWTAEAESALRKSISEAADAKP